MRQGKYKRSTSRMRNAGVPLARAQSYARAERRISPLMTGILAVTCCTVIMSGAIVTITWLDRKTDAAPVGQAAAQPTVIETPVVAGTAPEIPSRAEFSPVVAVEMYRDSADVLRQLALQDNAAPITDPTTAAASTCYDDLRVRAAGLRIPFGVSSNTLPTDIRPALEELAAIAADCADVRIIVAGHSDGTGDAATNMDLSWQRAEEVIAQLAASGFDVGAFEPVGFGARAPLLRDGVALVDESRRVEFNVVSMAEVGR